MFWKRKPAPVRRWSYIDTSGKPAFDASFQEVFEFSEGFAWVELPDGCSFIDVAGRVICEQRFPSRTSFYGGRARMMQAERYGFLDPHGQWAIEPIYREAEHFSEGLAFVRGREFTGFIDVHGGGVIDLPSGSANRFCEGLARVKRGRGFFFIDRAGQDHLGPYDFAEDFSSGVAYVFHEDQRFFVDASGRRCCTAAYDWFAPYCHAGRIAFRKGERYGALDVEGRVVVAAEYDDLSVLNDGHAIFQRGDQRGVLDRDGNILLSGKFADLDLFGYGDGLIRFSRDGKRFGFLTLSGETAVEPRYLKARPFSEGFAGVA